MLNITELFIHVNQMLGSKRRLVNNPCCLIKCILLHLQLRTVLECLAALVVPAFNHFLSLLCYH
jgi:hypothetical protein